MIRNCVRRPRTILILIGLVLMGACLFYFRHPLWQFGQTIYLLFSDRGRIESFITSFGWAAPLVFMLIQISQVLLAPIPGEATGFIGGFLFGGFHGFIYSSVALGIGSWLNFLVGRMIGERYVRRIIRPETFTKLNRLVRRQGVIIIFFLFVFPGFPKDWLCLFLGITSLPLKVFLWLATIGRMPGTLLLSFQGELLFERNYTLLLIILGVSLIFSAIVYVYRERLYCWIEKNNHSSNQ